ncbi:MAG TPA: glycosyltransferase family 39 protein [Anaerolineae bacterium]|nr:glycosyltransferase family 39 protein [Anaerolineae bacterium]
MTRQQGVGSRKQRRSRVEEQRSTDNIPALPPSLQPSNRPSSPPTFHSSTLPSLLALLITALAFALRLRYLTLFNFHIDEFFTLAAAKFIAQSGAPIYPTGLFYDPGLPYSYLTGLLFSLLGFSEALGRWPAVLFGTLGVATLYWLGWRILRSPWVGLLAAFWLAISFDSITWSGRARMISLAQWLGLLSLGLLWLGLTHNRARYRLGLAASYALTLLSHFSTVVLMPAWFAAGAGLWLLGRMRVSRALLRDSVILIGAFSLAVGAGVFFQPPPSPDFAVGTTDLGTKTEALTGKFLQLPGDLGHAWENYAPYFLNGSYGPLLGISLVGLAISLSRWRRGQPYARDLGAFFTAIVFLTVLAVLSLAIAPHWQRERYLLMQLLGPFLLLAAHGCREVINLLPSLLGLERGAEGGLRLQLNPARFQLAGALLLAGLLSLAALPPLQELGEAGPTGWNRYDQALAYVRDQWASGDQVMTMHPPAALIYLEQDDYYLDQSAPKLIRRPDGQLGNRYSGAVWLDSAEQFSPTLANAPRLWLVTQEFWLFNSYDEYLQQQILWQMDKLWGEGGVWALRSRPDRWPLAQQPHQQIEAQFDGGAKLLGYTAEPSTFSPGSQVRLTFFWQGNVPYGAKVMVHLRDSANNTVAQADHFIYDGKVPSSRWASLLSRAPALRDGATLVLPAELSAGPYRLLVGFYHPETFERLGVSNDQSGESAVIVAEWGLNSNRP